MIVTIKTLRPKHKEIPWFTVPFQDPKSKVFLTGQENMNEAQLKKEPVIVEINQQIPVTHNEKLNSDIRTDAIKLGVLKNIPEIAKSRKSADPVKHLFYLYNEEEDSREFVETVAIKAKAYKVIDDNTSREALEDLAYFMKIDPREQPTNVILAKIYREAEASPASIVAFAEGNNKSLLFVRKLQKNELITLTNGAYYAGEILLGYTENEVSGFLNSKENKELKDRLGQELNKLSPSSSKKPSGKQGSSANATGSKEAE